MNLHVDLAALIARPFGRRLPPTSADYFPTLVDAFDRLDWYWSGLTTHDHAKQKQEWWEQYSLPRNRLVLVDDIFVAGALASKDLNLCRQFVAAGGRAYWIDSPRLLDVSGSTREFLATVVREALCAG